MEEQCARWFARASFTRNSRSPRRAHDPHVVQDESFKMKDGHHRGYSYQN
jgi:hypothetical protein